MQGAGRQARKDEMEGEECAERRGICGAGEGERELYRCSLVLAERRLLLLGLEGLHLEQGIELAGRLPVRVAHAVCPREVLEDKLTSACGFVISYHGNDVPGRSSR